MRPFPESTCVECGRKMPAGNVQKCADSAGGFCNWHIPEALGTVSMQMLEALKEAQAWMIRLDSKTPEQCGAQCVTLSIANAKIDAAIAAAGGRQ